MEIQKIAIDLRSNIDHIMQSEDRNNVFGAAFLIDKINVFFRHYISYFNQKNLENSDLQFTNQQIAYLDSMLSELSGNFFPMDHTNAPLGALQITNREEINSELQTIENLHRHMEHLLRDIGQLVKQAAEAEDRLNQLANP